MVSVSRVLLLVLSLLLRPVAAHSSVTSFAPTGIAKGVGEASVLAKTALHIGSHQALHGARDTFSHAGRLATADPEALRQSASAVFGSAHSVAAAGARAASSAAGVCAGAASTAAGACARAAPVVLDATAATAAAAATAAGSAYDGVAAAAPGVLSTAAESTAAGAEKAAAVSGLVFEALAACTPQVVVALAGAIDWTASAVMSAGETGSKAAIAIFDSVPTYAAAVAEVTSALTWQVARCAQAAGDTAVAISDAARAIAPDVASVALETAQGATGAFVAASGVVVEAVSDATPVVVGAARSAAAFASGAAADSAPILREAAQASVLWSRVASENVRESVAESAPIFVEAAKSAAQATGSFASYTAASGAEWAAAGRAEAGAAAADMAWPIAEAARDMFDTLIMLAPSCMEAVGEAGSAIASGAQFFSESTSEVFDGIWGETFSADPRAEAETAFSHIGSDSPRLPASWEAVLAAARNAQAASKKEDAAADDGSCPAASVQAAVKLLKGDVRYSSFLAAPDCEQARREFRRFSLAYHPDTLSSSLATALDGRLRNCEVKMFGEAFVVLKEEMEAHKAALCSDWAEAVAQVFRSAGSAAAVAVVAGVAVPAVGVVRGCWCWATARAGHDEDLFEPY